MQFIARAFVAIVLFEPGPEFAGLHADGGIHLRVIPGRFAKCLDPNRVFLQFARCPFQRRRKRRCGRHSSGVLWRAFDLARLFFAAHKELSLVMSSALSWEEIGKHNVIFVGPPKFNLQAKDLPVQQDFVIEHGRITNLRPRNGEPKTFVETWTPDRTNLIESHALITRLPGLHGAGRILMLASTTTEGTRAAVEYVTRPDYAARLVASVRGAKGELPKYFQAVIRAKFKAQTPIQVELVVVHTLQ